MTSQALQHEAKKLVDYIISLGSSFQIIRAQPETHIGAIITDAVLQVNHGWKTHVGPRVQRIKNQYPQAATISGILRLLQTTGARDLLNWKGTDEQKRFHQTVEFFDREKIESFEDLRRWLASDDNRNRLLTKSPRKDAAGIPRIGNKTADYYRVMVGLPYAVAIDRLIADFLKDAGVRGRSQYDKARAIVQLSAPILSAVRNTNVRPIDLDQSIWAFQSDRKERKGAEHGNSGDDTAPLNTKCKEVSEMNRSDRELIVTLPSHKLQWLNEIAEAFDVEAPTLARIWIVERLKQLYSGYEPPREELPHTANAGNRASGDPIFLQGTIVGGHVPKTNNPGGVEPLGIDIWEKESKKLPWTQHVVRITLVLHNNPHRATLYIYTGHPEFPTTKGAYVKPETRFVQDMVSMGLHKGNHAELEVNSATNTMTITTKLP